MFSFLQSLYIYSLPQITNTYSSDLYRTLVLPKFDILLSGTVTLTVTVAIRTTSKFVKLLPIIRTRPVHFAENDP